MLIDDMLPIPLLLNGCRVAMSHTASNLLAVQKFDILIKLSCTVNCVFFSTMLVHTNIRCLSYGNVLFLFIFYKYANRKANLKLPEAKKCTAVALLQLQGFRGLFKSFNANLRP